jgi:CubicO group peptidase (beta-lactamase class C family)
MPAAAPNLPRSTPEEQGVDPGALLRTVDALVANPELHSVTVVRHGHVVAEGWARPYGPDLRHQLYSLSKAFTATAVGLAVGEGRLALDDLVVDLLADRAPAEPGPLLGRLAVRHLLTMTTGHDEDPSEAVFESGRDWVRAFVDQPLTHEPGTHFVYNTAATYVLSAILRQVTGERLLTYLRPRLLDPLGITGATWERSPQGIDTGGFGLSVRTEDIAALGQLYLDDGVWRGRRLLPEGWVAAASAAQVPNGDPVTGGDWWQGYGYQIWRCRHGAYRGDGAFGQFMVVLPHRDTVVAITSAVADMQASLDALWEHLLPGLHDEPLAPDEAARAALAERLAGLRLEPPAGAATSPAARLLAGRTIAFDDNPWGLRSAVLEPGDVVDELRLQVRGRTGTVAAGHGDPVPGRLPFVAGVGMMPRGAQPALVGAAWADEATYVLTARYVESPFVCTARVEVEGDRVVVHTSVNVSFGPTQGPVLVGRLVPDAGGTP